MQVTELGYLVSSSDLLLADADLDCAPSVCSSVDAMMRTGAPSLPTRPAPLLSALIRGPQSMGALLGDAACIKI